jgi:hypothetical protein
MMPGEGRSPRKTTAMLTANKGIAPTRAAERARPMRAIPPYRSILAKLGANNPARMKGQAASDARGRIGENKRANTHNPRALTTTLTATAEEGFDRPRPSLTRKWDRA